MSANGGATQFQPVDEIEAVATRDVLAYEAVELHTRHEFNWGVVGLPHGALAENEHGGLLMRMTRDDARFAAQALSRQLVASLADPLS